MKISERFRPPPRVTLPQSVINRLVQVDSGGGPSSRTVPSYDFELEETVLKRIGEWRAAKDKQLYERGERIRRKEQELARLAEEEQKRKLNQICYPETDDLSSASEDDGEDEVSEENDESIPSGSSEEQVAQIRTSAAQYSQFNKFDTILIPTVLPSELTTSNRTSASDELITSAGGLPTSNVHIPKSTNLLNNNNYNKINYSDFENDTSSPFDNMELKTMNDLDILAQVLNLNAPSSGSERSPEESNDAKPIPTEEAPPACPTTTVQQTTVPSIQQPQFTYSQQPQQYQHGTYTMPTSASDYYKSYNSYHYNYCQYTPPTSTSSANCYTPTAAAAPAQPATVPYHSPNAQFQYQPTTPYNYYPYTSAASNSPATQPTYAHNYLYNNSAASTYYNYPTAVVPTNDAAVTTEADSAAAASSNMKSKSKSVPDIVRQLDEEVQDSALRRTRNNSQSNAERQRQDGDATMGHSDHSASASGQRREDFTLYNQLSPGDQNLVKRIGSMGFPLERVAAVLKRLGNDDKKIVEHLIPLSELLDLGFEEEKISEALIKFGNNKHKALDYLIS